MDQELQSVWKDILASLRVSVSDATFRTWFANTTLLSLEKEGGRAFATIGCISPYVKSTIEKRYHTIFEEALSKSIEKPCDVEFSVTKDSQDLQTLQSTPLFAQNTDSIQSKATKLKKVNLRKQFSFDNFAVSSSNQMAFAAAKAVSEQPGTAYNPLFIWGGVGVGKTHLMSAAGRSILGDEGESKLLFCTGEDFTNDIVEGIRNNNTIKVREKYRKLDILLVDDIQFIAGKEAVQEEFFHTFNTLVAHGGQIIMTSDKPPSEITKLEERLRSRFEAGLIVDIANPDFELRCAIIQIKVQERGLDIPMDLVQLIAGNIDSARKIQGFLVRLTSEVSIKKTPLDAALIERLVQKGGEEPAKMRTNNPQDVVTAVSSYFSVGKRNLLGSSRARPVARPRQILMYLLRTELNLSLQEVGRLVGGRDHTTVMHAVNKITHLASENVNIREDISGIKKSL